MTRNQHSKFLYYSTWSVCTWLLALISFWFLLEMPGYVLGRAFYDDELDTFFTSQMPFLDIVKLKYSGSDPDPFGHFIFFKALFEIFGTHEIVAFMGSIFFSALSLVFLYLSYLRFGGSNRLLALVLLGLNPLFLIHGSAVRWYPLWTFFATASFYLLIRNSKPSNWDIYLASLLTVVAFYISYLTLFFGFAVSFWLLLQREFRKAVLFIFSVVILCAPWASTFLRHLFASHQQFFGKEIKLWSGAYTAFTLFSGETMSPAQWISWFLWFAALVPLFSIYLVPSWQDKRRRLILILCGTIFLLPMVFGFIKIRSFMFYSGILYLFIALVIDRALVSEKWLVRSLAKLSIVCTLSTCILGFIHLSKGLYYHKQGLSDPILEIVTQVELWSKESPTVVFTTNPVLVYYLSLLPEYPRKIRLVTPYRNFLSTKKKLTVVDERALEIGPFERGVFIYSFLGSADSDKRYANYQAFKIKVASLAKNSVKVFFKPDPEYLIKMRLFPHAHLDAYRFVLEMVPKINEKQSRLLEKEYISLWFKS